MLNTFYITIIAIIFLFFGLYRNISKPSVLFLITILILIISGAISSETFLSGFGNKQIIIIFLLMVLTVGIRKGLRNDIFYRIFKLSLSPFEFRLRMVGFTAIISSVLNNTPVVALMIPYVKAWADAKGIPASKFLIPLSFAAIMGGMITVVGTSTNLLLNGLIEQQELELLGFSDFFFLGSLISISGIAYLSIFGDKLLPSHIDNKKTVLHDIKDYIVETQVVKGSHLIGKTIQEAGLRHLKELFLVEIKRGDRIITVVDSNRLIQEGDRLYFTGNTQSILRLIEDRNGLVVPEESHITANRFFNLSEAIIPTGSNLIGETLKSSNFRDTYKGSVISIYRNGVKVSGNLGEIKLMAGDFLLLLINDEQYQQDSWKDIILIKKTGAVSEKVDGKKRLAIVVSIALLLLGVTGLLDLFIAVFIGVMIHLVFKLTNFNLVKNNLDFDLLIILVSSLALGAAIQNSGVANQIVNHLFLWKGDLPVWTTITLLFIITLAFTTFITNAAAVTLMFPIAYQMAEAQSLDPKAFFVTIAFAASSDFITPIGYQTNLMVMGPGNYNFADYFKIGFPLLLIYSMISIVFILNYYSL